MIVLKFDRVTDASVLYMAFRRAIEESGYVPYPVVLNAIGSPVNDGDSELGWTSLDDAKIDTYDGKWAVMLPEPTSIKEQ